MKWKDIKELQFALQWRCWKMSRPNNIEKEINAIRVSLYEETKGMSPSEMNAYIKEQTAPINAEFGLQPINGVKVEHRVAL